MRVTPRQKILLKGMNLEELENFALSIQEKPFRGRQLFQWIYQKGISDFQNMSNLPQRLRDHLQETCQLQTLTVLKIAGNEKDETFKVVFQTQDGFPVEAVYIPEERRVTVCISSQIGCPLRCTFCATGKAGFQRNLEPGEIIEQYLWLANHAPRRITNVVFMGMGEPFLNYENVLKVAYLLNSELGPGIAARRITISTVGIPRSIRRFTDEGHKFKLAISLNAPNQYLRSLLMPINKKYPLKEILAAARGYTSRTAKRITFEYVLIPEYNNSLDNALELVNLLSSIPCKLNVIPYNPVEDSIFRAPTSNEINEFIEILYNAPFTVTLRRSRGRSIQAACGQLAGKYI